MQKRNLVNSPRLLEFKKEKRKKLAKKALAFVFCFFVFITLLAFLSRISRLQIKEINIIGNVVIDTEALKNNVKEKLRGNYLWFLPKANLLYYPKNDIQNELNTKFKRLKDVIINIKNKQTLEISAIERTPKYIWCGDNHRQIILENQKCYFLDEEGYIFDEAPYFSGEVYFKFYGLITGGKQKEIPFGFYFEKQNLKNLILFKETLEKMGLKPVALSMLDENIKIFLSTSKTSAYPEIIFKKDSDFPKVAENLQSALVTEPLRTNLIKKYSSLLYIDLRFGNKVYYKFR